MCVYSRRIPMYTPYYTHTDVEFYIKVLAHLMVLPSGQKSPAQGHSWKPREELMLQLVFSGL